MARWPETRKQTHPIMSGSQIQPLVWRAVRPWANAATRLSPKDSVPANRTAALSQPISPAATPTSATSES